MRGRCSIKDKYDNGYQSPIEFEFHLSGYIQRRHAFWISSTLYIITYSMIGLSFQSPCNNLGVIHLDGGWTLLASLLFASQSLFRHSFFLPGSSSCRFYDPWIASTTFCCCISPTADISFNAFFSHWRHVTFLGALASISRLFRRF